MSDTAPSASVADFLADFSAQRQNVSRAEDAEAILFDFIDRAERLLAAPSAQSAVAPTLEEVLEQIDAAIEMVAALCQPRGSDGARNWTMSIPADPQRDPDLVIGRALYSARAALLP